MADTRLCYLHDVPLLTAGDKCACPQCGTLYPCLPAGEPDCSAPAQLPGGRGRSSSPFAPAGASYSIPRGWQVSADAAPGGSLHPQADRARQLTQET